VTRRNIISKIRLALQLGPMSTHDLLIELQRVYPDLLISRVSSAIFRLRHNYHDVFIKYWEHNTADGQKKFFPRAYFALGHKADAPKPPPLGYSEWNRRRYQKRRKKETVVNSVFALGATVGRHHYTKEMGRVNKKPVEETT
jgi:hypothetical protein